MDFDVKLNKPADDSLIWQERFSQRGVYILETETEEVGRQKALELLVQAIINRTTKSW
jgi:NOL1/NOP2/fmu family ribosome biogenesis protein